MLAQEEGQLVFFISIDLSFFLSFFFFFLISLIGLDIPFFACYGATKTYSDFFSRSLNLEFKSKGIIIEVNYFKAFTLIDWERKKKLLFMKIFVESYACLCCNKHE